MCVPVWPNQEHSSLKGLPNYGSILEDGPLTNGTSGDEWRKIADITCLVKFLVTGVSQQYERWTWWAGGTVNGSRLQG